MQTLIGRRAVLSAALAAAVTIGSLLPTPGGTAAQALPRPDLNIPAAAGPSTMPVGSVASYTFRLRNSGPVAANEVRFVADFRGLQPLSVNVNVGTLVCGISGNDVVCKDPQMNAGEVTSITVRARAPQTPGPQVVRARIDPENTVVESNETNNGASIQTQVTP